MATGLALEGLALSAGGAVVLDGLSLRVGPGQVHALVGESGSGKTLSALACLGLLPDGVVPTEGTVRLGEASAAAADVRTLASWRGAGVAFVPADPLLSLGAVHTAGWHVEEALRLRCTPGVREAALALLREVGFEDAPRVHGQFPHQLSGGMRQRVLLAAALAAGPSVLIADEPTSALDAALRWRVVALLRALAAKRGLGLLLITHDLDVAREAGDEVTVLYAGRVMEQGPARAVLEGPRHPYTVALAAARPRQAPPGEPLPALPGACPPPAEVISGCRFHPRCPRATARCRAEVPGLRGNPSGRRLACHEVEPE